MNSQDIETNYLKIIANVEYYKDGSALGESDKYAIINYITPINLEGFVTE